MISGYHFYRVNTFDFFFYLCDAELQSSGKTTRFNCLPKILSFFLKRFRFDIERMKKMKVHDRLEFPDTLDMAPYLSGNTHVCMYMYVCSIQWGSGTVYVHYQHQTRVFLYLYIVIIYVSSSPEPQGAALYGLSGVVVHAGRSANRGHFYSLIVRHPDPAEQENEGGGGGGGGYQWVKLDDENVTPFDRRCLERDAFGGEGPSPQEEEDGHFHDEDDGDEGDGEWDQKEEGDCGRRGGAGAGAVALDFGDVSDEDGREVSHNDRPPSSGNGRCDPRDKEEGEVEVEGEDGENGEDLYYNDPIFYSDEDDDDDDDEDDDDDDDTSDSDDDHYTEPNRLRSAVMLFYTRIDPP